MDIMVSRLWLILLVYGLVDVAAIAAGLLIFFKGRAYVRKKYGRN